MCLPSERREIFLAAPKAGDGSRWGGKMSSFISEPVLVFGLPLTHHTYLLPASSIFFCSRLFFPPLPAFFLPLVPLLLGQREWGRGEGGSHELCSFKHHHLDVYGACVRHAQNIKLVDCVLGPRDQPCASLHILYPTRFFAMEGDACL